MQVRQSVHYIEHLIEPDKLLMTWQDNIERTRYVVAELNRIGSKISLHYLVNSKDFKAAQEHGFNYYPAFQNIQEIYENGVLDSLMRRLPPKTRADYPQYLEGFRINPSNANNLSDFALLGYTGAKLPSDNFAIINPFNNIKDSFEFLLEAAGYRHIMPKPPEVNFYDHASFKVEYDSYRQENEIKIFINNQHIGYVTRPLIPYFSEWMSANRIMEASVEKKNPNPDQPDIYLYVRVG